MSLDWLIVGGGIHGVHVAARLIGEGGVPKERLRIVDPADRLLERWRACTSVTGMSHLRSPSVHHLDLDPNSLQRFAGIRRRRKRGLFAPPYDRPALALFDAHSDHVVETFGLSTRHLQDRAQACFVDQRGATLRLAGGDSLRARHLVLALGAAEQPRWPDWAPRPHPRVAHVFEPGFDAWPARAPERVAVIGGGISAGQVAIRLAAEGHEVHLVARHALREFQFDSDPGWLGPKYMRGFEATKDLARRRELISLARHTGSMTPDVRRALRHAMNKGEVQVHEAEPYTVDETPSALSLPLSSADVLEVDRVLLATGFAPARPGGELVDELIESANLPCAECGYPIVDTGLRWHEHVHVCGPLAELELGPASRNISGARRAGDRLVTVARDHG